MQPVAMNEAEAIFAPCSAAGRRQANGGRQIVECLHA
jgi:hypothetical protein